MKRFLAIAFVVLFATAAVAQVPRTGLSLFLFFGTGSGGPPLQVPVVQVPVVTCSTTGAVTTGESVCTLTATNSPTSWAIVAQSCSLCFAINIASGAVTGGANAANIFLTSTITVTASNAAGTSAQQVITINNLRSLQVATNAMVPNNSLAGGTQTIMCRIGHYTRGGVTSISMIWAGWWVNALTSGANFGSEVAIPNYTGSSWVEYPVGTYTQIDNGLTVVSGTNTSSTAPVSVSIPANTQFYTWRYAASGGTLPTFTTSGSVLFTDEACQSGTSGVPTTPSAVLPTDNHSRALSFGPVAMIGPSSAVAPYLLGDSRTAGEHDTADGSYNRGDLARSIGPTYNYINAGVSGDDPSMWLLGGSNRRALAQYATHIVSESNFNFFFNKSLSSASAAVYYPWMQGFFSPKPFIRTTMEPWTTGTFLTAAGQTIPTEAAQVTNLNTIIRGDSHFVELRTPVEDQANLGKWITSPSPPYTADGVHANQAGYLQQATTASTIVAAIAAASPGAAMPSVNMAGTGSFDTTTPKFGGASYKGPGSISLAGLSGSSAPFTTECWFKGTSVTNFASIFTVGQGWLQMRTGGLAGARINSGASIVGSVAVNDGNWHHWALTDTGAAQVVYVDGNSVATATSNYSNLDLNTSTMSTNAGGGPNELDECAYWSIVKYNSNFTPPTNAYNGNEAGLVALYHFDSNFNGLSTLTGQTTNGVPIVNSDGYAPCTVATPVTTGQTICTFTANNTPTNWSLSSQSCSNGFTINSSGTVKGGSSAGSLVAGTCTLTVTASNTNGTSGSQTNSVVVTGGGGGLPAGVSLVAIDGETVTGTTMTHSFYTRNGFTRVTAGTFNPSWDSAAFFPIMTFYTYADQLSLAVALGYNVSIDALNTSGGNWSNYNTFKIWELSSFPGAGSPTSPESAASAFVAGTYTDEPFNQNTNNDGSSPIYLNNDVPGTTIAGGPVLIAQTSVSAANGQFGSDHTGPPMTSFTNPATFWTTANPGSQHRGVDMTNMDFYWFADSTDDANSRKFSCAQMVYESAGGPDCTTSQMARCSGYGMNVSQMRTEYFGTGTEVTPEVPATTPLGIYVEEGNGNQTGGPRNITAGELICAAWDSIIHGARFLSYFYWPDVTNLSPGDPIYDAVKATNTLITAQASMLNSPFAKNYVTVSLSDGNTNSYIFPNINFDPTTGWFGQGLEVAAKWFGNKFYVLATTKYAEFGYTSKTATFTVAGGGTTATVIYSSDNASPSPISITSGHFSDTFPNPWSVRIYRIDP